MVKGFHGGKKMRFLMQKLRILKFLKLLIKHDFHEKQKFPENNVEFFIKMVSVYRIDDLKNPVQMAPLEKNKVVNVSVWAEKC